VHAPLISVVLPVFNGAATITRAVASIQAQRSTDWELIVVDDGSTDQTVPILQKLAAVDQRIRLFPQPHQGIVSALNLGLNQGNAPFIARMDADDEAYPDRFSEQVALLAARPDIGLVSGLVEFGGERWSSAGYALHTDWMNTLRDPVEIGLNRFIESPLAHPSVMFRRVLIAQLGGYRDGDFPEDYELWLRWLDAGVKMAKVPRVLLRWNDTPGRLSRQDDRYRFEAFYRCKAVYLARWLKANVPPSRKLLVWGAGRPTRRRAGYLVPEGICIGGYIDIDPRKIGRQLSGAPVFGPKQIPAPADCFVLGYVAKRGARDLARNHLRSCGFVEGEDFVMAA
jgi:glycosyltransferase involved in cell wall biosynthesis